MFSATVPAQHPKEVVAVCIEPVFVLSNETPCKGRHGILVGIFGICFVARYLFSKLDPGSDRLHACLGYFIPNLHVGHGGAWLARGGAGLHPFSWFAAKSISLAGHRG